MNDIVKLIFVDKYASLKQLHSVGDGRGHGVTETAVPNEVDKVDEEIRRVNPLDEQEVDEPLEVDSWVLVEDRLQLFDLLGKVGLARGVADAAQFLLLVVTWPCEIRIFNDVVEFDFDVLSDCLLDLLLELELGLVVLLVEWSRLLGQGLSGLLHLLRLEDSPAVVK